jgi:poly-gamma-glutamate synthesis protein (capsule biosynthesis protein)
MPDETITLSAVGDIMVAQKNYQETLQKVSPIFQAADIAFFNCETAYATGGSPASGPHGASPNDPEKMKALVDSGLNVCTFANNHTIDWGLDALVECRERLEALDIAVCGAGRNMDEARAPAVVERKGIRVAFLGYLCVGPDIAIAEEHKPGCAMVRAYTHYQPLDYQPGTPAQVITWCYKEDLSEMVSDIERAKKVADIVIVTPHWGIHNVRADIPDYEFEMGHAAIDAGADLILGHSTHNLKGIEVYRGKVIFHSMGDFAMEYRVALREGELRMVHSETYNVMLRKAYPLGNPDSHKTLIVKCAISKKGIERVSFVPALANEDKTNPEPLLRDDPRAQEVFDYINDVGIEAGLTTGFKREGDEVVVEA